MVHFVVYWGGLVCTSRTYYHVLRKAKKQTFWPFVCNMRKAQKRHNYWSYRTVTLLQVPGMPWGIVLTGRRGGELVIPIWTVHQLSLIQLSRETCEKKADDGMGSIFICVDSFFWERGGWTQERQSFIPNIYTVYLLKSLLKVHN